MRKKKMFAPIVVTLIVVAYYVAFFSFILAYLSGIWKYIFGIIPLLLSAVVIKVCIERINEIRSGEEDDISKY